MPPKLKRHADSIAQSDYSSVSHDTYPHEFGAAKISVIKGTNGKDQFDGTFRDEHMYGLGGDDELWGLGGNDYLEGGSGDDFLSGGHGTDRLYGGAGNDGFYAFDIDKAYGDAGDDWFGASGSSQVFGGAGKDRFDLSDEAMGSGGAGNDRFHIKNDRPTVFGGAGFDVVEFDLKVKYFAASYVDDVLLLRINKNVHYDGFYKPQYLASDKTIEKIEWKDFELTLTIKADPTITDVIAQGDIEEGGTTTAPIRYIAGQSDPFARIRVMADDVLIGTCVADSKGEWRLSNIYNDLPEVPVSLTAVADYGTGTRPRTSESFDIIIGLPGGEIPGQRVYDLESDEASFLSTPNSDIDFGYRTFALGDVNGDGCDDLLIQSHDKLTVAYGSKTGFGVINDGARELVPDELTADEGFTIDTKSQGWNFPPTISKLGDFNGDGFDDFAVLRDSSKIFIIFGTDEALAPEDDGKISLTLQDLSRSQALAYSFGSRHISAAGDLNGDGYDDLVAEPGYYYYGPAVIYGHATSSSASVTRTGTSAAEILIGKAGDDILDGNGNADIFRGGRGNDTIRIGDAIFEKINAGRGAGDTVEFDGSGILLDARDFGSGQLRGIEAFDLTGTGDNTLILTAFDVFHLSPNRNDAFNSAESSNSLVVRGDDGDTLRLIDHPSANWTLADAAIGLDGSSGGDFDVYNLIDGTRILASVAVGEDVTLLH